MGLSNLVILTLVFAPIPLWIALLTSYNYYYDYVATTIDPVSTEQVYDFIVGRSL